MDKNRDTYISNLLILIDRANKLMEDQKIPVLNWGHESSSFGSYTLDLDESCNDFPYGGKL